LRGQTTLVGENACFQGKKKSTTARQSLREMVKGRRNVNRGEKGWPSFLEKDPEDLKGNYRNCGSRSPTSFVKKKRSVITRCSAKLRSKESRKENAVRGIKKKRATDEEREFMPRKGTGQSMGGVSRERGRLSAVK